MTVRAQGPGETMITVTRTKAGKILIYETEYGWEEGADPVTTKLSLDAFELQEQRIQVIRGLITAVRFKDAASGEIIEAVLGATLGHPSTDRSSRGGHR